MLSRCEALMRFAERELAEIEKKHSFSDSSSHAQLNSSTSLPQQVSEIETEGSKPESSGAVQKAPESNKEKLLALSKQISEETRRIVLLRAELKSRTDAAGGLAVAGFKDAASNKAVSPGFNANAGHGSSGGSASASKSSALLGSSNEGSKGEGVRGGALRPVPEEIIPELCQYVYIYEF